MDDHLSWDDVFLLLDEVKAMARGLLRREHGASLQTTALVLSALRRQRHVGQDWRVLPISLLAIPPRLSGSHTTRNTSIVFFVPTTALLSL